MTAWWLSLLVTTVAVALAVRLRLLAVHAARIEHEARGPLCTALLGLERLATTGSDAGVIGALELELRRAALALDDLSRPRRHASRTPSPIVDLGELLAVAAPVWHALAAEHRARLSVEPASGLLVAGDPVRLAQAVGNLVANAVEHGGGAVRVRARHVGATVRVEVADTGPGLPAPVDTLVARARRRRGRRGHGLAVAAQVATRHGGRLASGPSAGGARLVLELPAVPDPPPSGTAAAPGPRTAIARPWPLPPRRIPTIAAAPRPAPTIATAPEPARAIAAGRRPTSTIAGRHERAPATREGRR